MTARRGRVASRIAPGAAGLVRRGQATVRARRDPAGAELLAKVRAEHLTYLDEAALWDLRTLARNLDRAGIVGSIVEAGCALGGSAIVLAASKPPSRPLYVHDVFGMIPPPSERDGEDVQDRYVEIVEGKSDGLGTDVYYGYQPDLQDQVAANFERMKFGVELNHVHLIPGLFEDTLPPDGPVALAHVDGDWYDSVHVCLERLWPVLADRGTIVIDDYDHWSGCRDAVDDFVRNRSDLTKVRRNRLQLVKRAP